MSEYNLKIISTPYSSEIYFYPTPVIYGLTGKKEVILNFHLKLVIYLKKKKQTKEKITTKIKHSMFED